MAMMVNHADTIDRGDAPAPEFAEFPKMMTHPGHQVAKAAVEVRDGGSIQFVGGTNEQFAPMLVMTQDQQDYYAAKGYVSQGKSDAAAFARAQTHTPVPSGYVPQKYPMWAGGKIVNNEAEEAEALGERQDQLGIVREPVIEVVVVQEVTEVVIAEVQAEPDVKDREIIALKAKIDDIYANMDQIIARKLEALSKSSVPVTAAKAAAKTKPKVTASARGKKSWETRQKRAAEKAAAAA